MSDHLARVKPANAPPTRQGLDTAHMIRPHIIKRFLSRYPPPEWRYLYYRNVGTLEVEYPEWRRIALTVNEVSMFNLLSKIS